MRAWRHSIFLGWRYSRHHPGRSLTLACSLGLILWLPLGTQHLVSTFAAAMLSRAQSTPQLAGARGSRFDLVLHSLYFRGRLPATVTHGEVMQLGQDGLVDVIPLHAAFSARGQPLVGTSLDYFERRGLRLAQGGMFLVLGDCVVGASAARRLGLKPGDRVMSDPDNVFDITGRYPLNLLVRGVLAPAHSPDDEAVFADLKTVWVIEGIGHGHDELNEKTDPRLLVKKDSAGYVANSALRQYTEVTPANRASFHFHGDAAGFPVTGALVFPHDEKSGVIVEARHATARDPVQVVRAEAVIREILGLVFEVKRFLELNFLLVGGVMLVLFGLIVALAVRLRQREFETLNQLGCTRRFILQLVSTEILLLSLAAAGLAGSLTLLTRQLGPEWLLRLISS
jgi:putative ABC transport system permease protein